ncbi:leucine-rich repeat protein [bacterium]|nr:leucine-rich repeat protein [bacterium]
MINKLVVDNLNITLNEQTVLPFTYTFSMAGVHQVRIGLDNTDEICAYAFKDCEDLSKVKHIPRKITKIKRNAFENCVKLSQFDMPSQIEYVGPNVFDGCNNLKEINFESSTPPTGFFTTLQSNTNCYIPDGSKYEEISKEDINEYYHQHENAAFYEHREGYGDNNFKEVDFELLDLSEEGPQYYVDKWLDVHNHYNTIENRFRIRPESIQFVDDNGEEYNDIMILNSDSEVDINDINLNIKLNPDNATNSNVYLFSSNTNLLTVNNEGHIKIKRFSGTNRPYVNIYACAEPYYDNTYCSTTLRCLINPITVSVDLSDEEFNYDVSEINVTSLTDTLPQLTNSNSVTVEYSSSNEDVATIDNNGTVNIVGNGTTTITAEFAGNNAFNAKTVSYELKVNITEEEPIEEKTDLTDEEFNYSVSEFTATSKDAELPELINTKNINVSYSSSDSTVASINENGEVDIIQNGTTVIKAIFNGNDQYNAKEVSYTLIVNIPKEQEEIDNDFEIEYTPDDNGDVQIINDNN